MSAGKRFIINARRRGGAAKVIEVPEADYDRISQNIIRNEPGRIMVEEKVDGGIRRHFFAPSEITSVEEKVDDGWGSSV